MQDDGEQEIPRPRGFHLPRINLKAMELASKNTLSTNVLSNMLSSGGVEEVAGLEHEGSKSKEKNLKAFDFLDKEEDDDDSSRNVRGKISTAERARRRRNIEGKMMEGKMRDAIKMGSVENLPEYMRFNSERKIKNLIGTEEERDQNNNNKYKEFLRPARDGGDG